MAIMLYSVCAGLAFVFELLLNAATSQYTSVGPNQTSSNPFGTVSPAEPVHTEVTITSSRNFMKNNASSHMCRGNCSSLPYPCYNNCSANFDCIYGHYVFFNCTVKKPTLCSGPTTVPVKFQCRMCYMTQPEKEHTCFQKNVSCKVNSTPRQRVKSTCSVQDTVFCLGQRTFSKMVPCNWSSGYSWSVSLVLSVTLGGFGVDRFYLGYWKEGLGKFFSFGGLGVWTLIDAVLIGTGYLGPSDGSFYVR